MADKNRTLTVRVSEKDYEWLRSAAEKKDREKYAGCLKNYRVSDIVRELIRDARKNPEM